MDRSAIVDETVARELARRRSFERTYDRASQFRHGVSTISTTAALDTIDSYGWNGATRQLRDHQVAGLAHGLTAVNSANFSVPGSGKTATTLAIGAVHLAAQTIDMIIVVGPLSCFGPWERETKASLPTRLTTKRIRGSAEQRRILYEQVGRGDLLLLSYASAAADRSALINLCRSLKVMLVVDESHRVKRFRGGVWAPALMRIAEFAVVRCVLSGTPMPQHGRDLYSQLNILWPGGELTGPRDGFAAAVDRDFPALLNKVRPFMSRTPKADLGLPPYVVTRHDVALSGLQAEVYELIESNFRRRLADAADYEEQIRVLKRARPIRLLQAAANPGVLNRRDSYFGLAPINKPNPTLFERLAAYSQLEVPSKMTSLEALLQPMIAEGRKVVVWSNFVPNLDYVAASLRRLDYLVFQIDGRVPAGDELQFDNAVPPMVQPVEAETREQIIDRFLSCPGAAVLVTNPASCSESISLHSACQTAIYLDRTYDCALYLQSIDRIHRLGLAADARVEVHLLLATIAGRPTIDSLVDVSLAAKESTMAALLQGAELRPTDLPEDPLDRAEGDDKDMEALLRFLLGEETTA